MQNLVETLAHNIVRCHQPLALQPAPMTRLAEHLTRLSQDDKNAPAVDANTQAVLAACATLDFVQADAQCIASAWQRQTMRSGQFDPSTWPTDPQDFGLQPMPRATSFAPCPKQLTLYAVLPDAAWVARMAEAGVPTLQLRFKSDDPSAVKREVQAAVAAVQGTAALLFINDHWENALEAGAYGVHLGQEDLEGLSSTQLAAIRTAGLRLGVSSHGYAEMLRADAVNPSYIAMGAVYATTLKRMTTPPQGPARLKMYAPVLRHHATVAIGGLDATRLPEVLASGVGSVAVVRALVAADQPEAHAAELQKTITAHFLKARCPA